MIDGEKIGVGIVTCTRKDMFEKLVASLKPCDGIIDRVVVFEDTIKDKAYENEFYSSKAFEGWNCSHYEMGAYSNVGVGKAKNYCLEDLLREGCDHIFLIEDDMLIKDPKVFEKYIEASKVSGIQHFNYGPGSPFNRKQDIKFDLHNRHLLNQKSDPNPRLIIDYNGVKVDLFEHTVAMFSYYSKLALEAVGLIDTNYHNAWEHVDHTYQIIKANLHPPFWYFADIHDSLSYIEEQENAITQSSIANNNEQWTKDVMEGREIYKNKHGHYPNQPPFASEDEVLKLLKKLKP